MRIAISESLFLEFLSETSSLECFLVFFDIDEFGVSDCFFFSLSCVVINLLENAQDVDYIEYFFSKLWSSCSLLTDKSDDLSVSEPLKDSPDEFILRVVLSKLQIVVLFFWV